MSLRVNILGTLSGRVMILLLALVSSVVMARFLGPEGRGVFALVLLLPEFIVTFGLFGFDQANVVDAGLEPESRRTLVWHSFAISAIGGGILAIAAIVYLLVGAPGFASLIRGPLWLYVLPVAMAPGRMMFDLCWAVLRGMNRIIMVSVLDVLAKAASLSLLILFIWVLRWDVAGAVWTDTIVYAGSVFVMLWLLRNVGILGRPSFDSSLLKRSARFALPTYCASVLSYLNLRVDQLIIAMFLTPEQLGFYVIAVGLVERLWILPGSIAIALLPHLTNSPERDPEISAVVARHMMIWTGLACLVLFLIADVMVRILYSDAYSASVYPLRWLLPGIFMLSIGRLLVGELFARKKVLQLVGINGVVAAVNIAGNFVLVPQMGISGAAIASTLSYSLQACIVTYCFLRETGVCLKSLVPRPSDLKAYVSYLQQWSDRKTF